MPGPVGTQTGVSAAHLATFSMLKNYALARAGEKSDGTSEWDDAAADAVIEAFHDFVLRWPWLSLRKDPPGALALLAPITTLTVTATAGGTSGTLSATNAISLTGYILIPSAADYFIRITAHTAATADLTLDAVPETLTAKACTIVKIEYDLASDCGVLVDSGFWTLSGKFIPVIKEETLRQEHPQVPQAAWPASVAARVAQRKVRFSSYPSARERLEYPYSYEPADPSINEDLVIDARYRPILANRALSILYEAKREYELMKVAEGRYLTGVQLAQIYEERLLLGLGGHANRPRARRGYGN